MSTIRALFPRNWAVVKVVSRVSRVSLLNRPHADLWSIACLVSVGALKLDEMVLPSCWSKRLASYRENDPSFRNEVGKKNCVNDYTVVCTLM